MAIYSLSQRTVNAGTGQAVWELRTGAKAVRLLELGFSIRLANDTGIALGRPPARSTGGTAVSFLAEDFGDPASLSSGVVSWTSTLAIPPLVPTNFLRVTRFASGFLGDWAWRFPEGVTVAATSSLALYNVSTSSTFDMWAVIDE